MNRTKSLGDVVQVEWISGFLQILFGDSYNRVTGLDSIDLNRYELFPTSSALLFLYLLRSDLQIAYPEVRRGDLHRLIDWGGHVVSGDYKDVDRPTLFAYSVELDRLRESMALTNLQQLWSHPIANGLMPIWRVIRRMLFKE